MNNKTIIFSVIGLLVVLGVVSIFSFQFYTEEVYMPRWWTASCEPVDGSNMAEVDQGLLDRDGKFFYCTTVGTNKYIPDLSGMQCIYSISDFNFFDFDAWECPLDAEKDNVEDVCTKLTTGVSTPESLTIDRNRGLFTDVDLIYGGVTTHMLVKSPHYGLKVEDANGYDYDTTDTCLWESINMIEGNKVYTLNADTTKPIQPNKPVNMVTQLAPAISKQVLIIDGINNGEPIYIQNTGSYYPVIEDEGVKFVDTLHPVVESRIECVPPVLCDENAKIIESITQQQCDKYGGVIGSYAPVEGDKTTLCKYACDEKTGLLVLTDDCVSSGAGITCNDPEKPYWSPTQNKCVGVITNPDDDDKDSDINWWIIGGIVAFFLLIILILVMGKKKEVTF